MKRLISVVLSLALLLGVAAVAIAEGTERYPVVKMAVNQLVSTLDPLGDTVGATSVISQSYVEYLYSQTKMGGDLVPCIGKSFEKIDDYTYQVEIYDYVHDSAGNPITASDIAFSYTKQKEKGMMAASVNQIESVAVVSDYVVEFKLNTTAAGALTNTLTGCPIVSQVAYEADPDQMANNPITTGAYVVEEFRPSSGIIFVRNENYWQTPELTSLFSQANVERIEVSFISESAQLAIALETGAADIVYSLSNTEADNILASGGDLEVGISPMALCQVLLFNCSEDNPFAAKELRQAVLYAFDRAAMFQAICYGRGGVAYTYGSDVFGDYLPKWKDEDYYDYDPAKASELLAAAGYAPGELEFTCMTSTSEVQIRVAEMIQAYLSQIGIKMNIVSYDSALYNPYRFDPTQYDMRVDNKASGDFIVNTWKFSFDQRMFGGMTQCFYTGSELQALLETCLDEATHTPEHIDAFHQALKELAIGYGLFNDSMNVGYNSSVLEDISFSWFQKVVPGACTYAN